MDPLSPRCGPKNCLNEWILKHLCRDTRHMMETSFRLASSARACEVKSMGACRKLWPRGWRLLLQRLAVGCAWENDARAGRQASRQGHGHTCALRPACLRSHSLFEQPDIVHLCNSGPARVAMKVKMSPWRLGLGRPAEAATAGNIHSPSPNLHMKVCHGVRRTFTARDSRAVVVQT